MQPEGPHHSINAWNAEFIESVHQRWLADPASVDEQWQRFFEGFDLGLRRAEELEKEVPQGGAPAAKPAASAPDESLQTLALAPAPRPSDIAHSKQGRVDSLIYHYRDMGHLAADLDPLGVPRPFPEQLTLESFGLRDADLDALFDPGQLPLDNPSPLREIVQMLEDTYCRHLGAEYMHIQDREQLRWLQKRMEGVRNRPAFPRDHQLHILSRLMQADALERFLDTRYKGKKWFSLSGAESLISLLDEVVELGPINGVEEFTMGMAHRGRVNVLVNILNKTYEELFTEFAEAWEEDYVEGGGDVKYHRGYSTDRSTTAGNQIRLTMASNPSHLEFVNPVVLGRCRAKQRLRKNEQDRDRVVPILIHGDASFPAQGIVAECFNLVNLDGYRVGGAIHVVVNNQVGFTTDPRDARSGPYCTDIAKMASAPIFHVNGDDPESCAFVARLALEYRQAFKNDVVIDLWCYRKYGHNESDEASFTQPQMYETIARKTPVFDLYAQQLIRDGVISAEDVEKRRDELKEKMDSAQTRSRDNPVDPTPMPFARNWQGLRGDYIESATTTAASLEALAKVSQALGAVPPEFTPHRKLVKLLEGRGSAVEKNEPLDWAMGELLAYGTLLLDGHAVRLTGQDVERGTFSHRHAVLFDARTGRSHVPLNSIDPKQSKFCIHNSPLSEQSCVGYEYGYSLADPNMLIVWEAQFGDFANGAQVIIDQFIASAEIKWQRHSGLVLLLPHGYEGQGPEHSSARMERFLQLCADDNMQVVYPTSSAQMFHVLRRQLKRDFRTPLIVMTPKSMLRLKDAMSPVSEFTQGTFQRVIDDASIERAHDVSRLILCSGKIYYELVQAREKAGRAGDAALVRLEQLYPFPHAEVKHILSRYSHATEILWVQEEPMNAGAFRFVEAILREEFGVDVTYVGRDASATPAVGSSKIHAAEQAEILAKAFAPFDAESEETEEEVAESEGHAAAAMSNGAPEHEPESPAKEPKQSKKKEKREPAAARR
jgi:2-oxoglutarate dehydrogenase E1 component